MSDFFGFKDEAHMREYLGNSFVDTVLKSKVSERKMRVCKPGDWPCIGGGWHADHPFDYGDFHIVPHETLKVKDEFGNDTDEPLMVQRQRVRYQDMGRMITTYSVVHKGKTICWGGDSVDL